MRRATLVGWLVVTMVWWGRGSAAARPPLKELAPDPRPTPPGVAVVRLIHAGIGPRRPLRYRFPARWKRRLVVVVESRRYGGVPPFMTKKELHIDFTGQRGPAGLRVRFRVASLRLDQQRRAGDPFVKTPLNLATIRRTEGGGLITHRGLTRDWWVSVPRSIPAAQRPILMATLQRLRQVTVALPQRPVGRSARWKVTYRTRGLYRAQRSMFYSIVALQGQRLGYQIADRLVAGPQTVDFGRGAPTRMLSLRYEHSGLGWARLDDPLPVHRITGLGRFKFAWRDPASGLDRTAELRARSAFALQRR